MAWPSAIDEFIAVYPADTQAKLQKVRETIQKAAPEAQEKISYGIPTFTLHGNLVHFATSQNHIGFYPTPSAIEAFKSELKPYKTSRGTIQFPIDKPLPLALIRKMVRFRVQENLEHKAKKSY